MHAHAHARARTSTKHESACTRARVPRHECVNMPAHVHASMSVSALACTQTRALMRVREHMRPCVQLSGHPGPENQRRRSLLAPPRRRRCRPPGRVGRSAVRAVQQPAKRQADNKRASFQPACHRPEQERLRSRWTDGHVGIVSACAADRRTSKLCFNLTQERQRSRRTDRRTGVVSACLSHASTNSEGNERTSQPCFSLPVTDNKHGQRQTNTKNTTNANTQTRT